MDSLVGFIVVVKYGMPHYVVHSGGNRESTVLTVMGRLALKDPVHSAFTKPLQGHTFSFLAQKNTFSSIQRGELKRSHRKCTD